jgi:hypothetical protein
MMDTPQSDVKFEFTPEQLDLARHALGLGVRNRRSYRNRYVGEEPAWREMVAMGAARVKEARGSELTGGMPFFWLTRDGAKSALRPGESLDAEDFPDVGP